MFKNRLQVTLAFLFFVPNLHGVGYLFVKEKGIPDRLVPYDCPDGKMPESGALSPTQAHLYAWYKSGANLGEFKAEIEPYLSIIEQIMENESKYGLFSYDVFYHAQNGSFRFLQDFLKEFYALLNIQKPYNNFEFLRVFHGAVPKADVNQFLDNEAESINNHYNFDCLPKIRSKLLSVNLSLFGNKNNWGSYTFEYFTNSFSFNSFDIEWVDQSIETVLGLELTARERDQLQDLFKKIDSGGSLFQIFIPRELVNKCVYLCYIYGIPYQDKILNGCYDNTKQRYTKISHILDVYVRPNFLDFFQLNTLQARILISQDILLNPHSGVKLFRFVSENTNDTYQRELTQFVHAIVARYLAEADFFKRDMPFKRLAAMMFNK